MGGRDEQDREDDRWDVNKEAQNKNEVQVGRKTRRSCGVTNLAAILVTDISSRLRLLINKQYGCEIGLMTK